MERYLIILVWDERYFIIDELYASDVAATSFLRTWTKIAWDFYFEFVKQQQIQGDPNPRFDNHEIHPKLNNFTPPLESTMTHSIFEYDLAIYVAKESDISYDVKLESLDQIPK